MKKKMGSLIDRYSRLGISRQKKLPRLYDFGEAFEIDLSHEFQLYTFAAQPRSSSDNFSLTLGSKGNLTLPSLIFIFSFLPSLFPVLEICAIGC